MRKGFEYRIENAVAKVAPYKEEPEPEWIPEHNFLDDFAASLEQDNMQDNT